MNMDIPWKYLFLILKGVIENTVAYIIKPVLYKA